MIILNPVTQFAKLVLLVGILTVNVHVSVANMFANRINNVEMLMIRWFVYKFVQQTNSVRILPFVAMAYV